MSPNVFWSKIDKCLKKSPKTVILRKIQMESTKIRRIKNYLTRAWRGYFYNTSDREGGLCFAPPPHNSGTTGRIYKIQTACDRSRKFVERNLMLLTSRSPMTAQNRSKWKCLTIWSIWFCRALEPYEMEISQYNDMYRVWDTFKYHPKLSVSIFKVKVIQGHGVK